MKKFYTLIILCLVAACTPLKQSDEFWIKNKQNEQLYVRVDYPDHTPNQKLVFIEHGLASNLNHQVVDAIKKAFLDNNYTVITFDTRYALGLSGNNVKFARLSTYKEDLETVISWAKNKPFYHEPFALSGHSLGGAAVLQYSAQNPDIVDILVPVTPVISGNLWEASCIKNMTDFCKTWQQKGFFEYTDSKNHKTAVIPYQIITDTKSYNAYDIASKISARTLLIAAENDNVIAPSDLEKLAQKIKTNGREITLKSSSHNFEKLQNRLDLYRSVNQFIN